MAVPIRLTPPTSANVMASETSDTPAPDPVTATNLGEKVANLAVSPTQLVPSTHITRTTELDADEQALSLAISPATDTPSDVVETTEEPRGFFGLPRELRDEIYKLLDQTVEQRMWGGHDWYGDPKLLHESPGGCKEEDENGKYPHSDCEHYEDFERYDLAITVSLPQLRLVNKQFKQEYDESYELANNRLKISASSVSALSVHSELAWGALKLPSISRHSTELELEFMAHDHGWYPGCVYCGMRVGTSTDNAPGELYSLEPLLKQLPDVESIHIDLLSVVLHEKRFLGCPPEHDKCRGFRYWRHGFLPGPQPISFDYRLPRLVRDFIQLDCRSCNLVPRRPPKVNVSVYVGRYPDKPYEDRECVAIWTAESGLKADLDAARRCNMEIYRT